MPKLTQDHYRTKRRAERTAALHKREHDIAPPSAVQIPTSPSGDLPAEQSIERVEHTDAPRIQQPVEAQPDTFERAIAAALRAGDIVVDRVSREVPQPTRTVIVVATSGGRHIVNDSGRITLSGGLPQSTPQLLWDGQMWRAMGE